MELHNLKQGANRRLYRMVSGSQGSLRPALKAALCLGIFVCLTGCARGGNSVGELSAKDVPEPGSLPFTMGADVPGKTVRLAGETIAAVINNTVPGAHVSMADSKGAPSDLVNLMEGELDFVMADGRTVYEAYSGTGMFEGEEPMSDLRILGACYPSVSSWVTKNGKTDRLTYVHELKGKSLSAGTEGSATAAVSDEVFKILEIDEGNTAIRQAGISEGADGLKEGWADGVHGFLEAPAGAFFEAAGEEGLTVLSYTEEELEEILALHPWYYREEIPAMTYPGQTKAVDTFGVKNLLVCREQMEEDIAWEVAMALDLNGPVYASGHSFMWAIGQKDFLCTNLPIPLHPGARAYYEEAGFLIGGNE